MAPSSPPETGEEEAGLGAAAKAPLCSAVRAEAAHRKGREKQ